MRLLSDLIARAALDAQIAGNAAIRIESITTDSRQVTPGALFVAMPGVKADGAQFIPDAVKAGAVAVMMQDPSPHRGEDGRGAPLAPSDKSSALSKLAPPPNLPPVGGGITIVRVRDMRAAVSVMAAAFYCTQPRYPMAITGTDGKTSTADFVRQLATLSGHAAASIGTLGLRSPNAKLDAAFPANNTSPEPILLHKTLSELAAEKIDYVAIEASSHGLDQKRLDGVKFCAGAFTNLARDHLDYHQSLEAYFEAKSLLFSRVLRNAATAVLNHDDVHYGALKTICEKRELKVVSFGRHADSTYHIHQVVPHADGLMARVALHGKTHDLTLPFYGAFQLNNMLTAIGLLQTTGLKEEALVKLLPQLQGVPGRLERIATVHDAPIFVDYAHTPAALENILKTLRPHTAKKLHVVFGCGGDRDAGKRPLMGAAAAKFADQVIVTDDNPRSENAAAIRAAILAAVPGAQEIGDRAEAIHAAIEKLQTGDVLVVAGKGHETTQIIGKQTLHFNDADEIRKAVAA